MYDDDDTGIIEFFNLRKVADEMAKELKEDPITDSEVKNMIKMADSKYDGTRVDLDDFMRVMEMAGLLADKNSLDTDQENQEKQELVPKVLDTANFAEHMLLQ